MVRNQGRPTLPIGELAAAGGVGVETVRFYQRRGLLPVPAKTGGARRYDVDAVRRLGFIRHAQAAGFTLREVGELLRMDAAGDRAGALRMSERRLGALDEQIRTLERARDALRRLAAECAGGGAGPCPILLAFGNGAPEGMEDDGAGC